MPNHLSAAVRPPFWKRVEVVSFVLVGVVLLVTGFTAARSFQAYMNYRAQARISREVITDTQDLLISIMDAETGQRGYLLTKDPLYLKPYDRAIVEVPRRVLRLREQTEIERSERADAAHLADLVEEKMTELRQTITLMNTEGLPNALAVVQTNAGENIMEQVRAVARKLTVAEAARLARLSDLALQRGRRSWLINESGDLVLAVMLALTCGAIFRSSRRSEELIGALREDEIRLRELRGQAETAEEHTRNILESITDGFVSFDKDWKITYLNAEAERIFGRPKSELIGKMYWDEFPELAAQDLGTRLRQAAAAQLPVSFETYLEDRKAWWEQNVYPGKDGSLSVYFRDVTERKRFDERTRHSQKLESLGVLAGGIAHDFNNLLTAILGSTSLALEEVSSGSSVEEHLRNVMAASERAAQLTRQMLAYSGRGRFVVEPVDLSQQIREITALLRASLGGNVELILNLVDGAFIEADAGQFQSVVMNLVINGAEAIRPETTGTLVISTTIQFLDAEYLGDNLAGDDLEPGSYVLLEVHDTGQGMDAATMARIFDPFFTTKFTGRGLGLAAVLGIVRGHKGAIKVYSHPGQGTTFKLFFPVLPHPISFGLTPADTADHKGEGTILVVDDEEVVLKMAESTLRRYGYRVLLAANGREAVDVFRQQPDDIALVLLDMTMPVLSGEETLNEMKAIRPGVRVIVSSGYNEIEALRRFGRGVAGFLQKPYRAAALAEKIKVGLQQREDAIN